MTTEHPRTRRDERLPLNYQLVLDIVESSIPGMHQSVHDVYLAARKRRPTIGFSTVYRALLRLRDTRLISETIIPGAPGAVYERLAPEHAHFFCVNCASVTDLDYHVPSSVVSRLARDRHVEVQAVSVALQGVCGACKSKLRP